MATMLLKPILRWAEGLRFPRLLAITAALFAINLLVPDVLPFIDELLLGMATLLLARWRHRSAAR